LKSGTVWEVPLRSERSYATYQTLYLTSKWLVPDILTSPTIRSIEPQGFFGSREIKKYKLAGRIQENAGFHELENSMLMFVQKRRSRKHVFFL
jgi:hypothetical protein